MTNEQIQMIGISEAAFAHATEDQRIEWAKANTTALTGLCDAAQKYLVDRKDHVGTIIGNGDFTTGIFIRVEYANITYRLAPDYPPPVKLPCGYWFDTKTLQVTHGIPASDSEIEVTDEFAAYLRDKPDGECELRVPQRGDTYFDMSTYFDMRLSKWNMCTTGIYADDPKKPAIRWCKPRKATSQLPRYIIRSTDGIKYVWDSKGRYAVCHGAQMQDMWRITKAMNAIEASKIEASKDEPK